MESYWDSTAWRTYDIAIIGGGIVGISAAISCAERYPNSRIIVLERGHIPYGASTRNAGFASFGSLSEIVSDIELMGVDAALTLVENRLKGLALLKTRVGDSEIGYSENGAGEIFLNDHEALSRLDEVNRLLSDLFPASPFRVRNDLIHDFGLSRRVQTLVHTPFEGTLHSVKLLQKLWQCAASLGVQVRTGSEVVDVLTSEPMLQLGISSYKQRIRILCRNVIVATNAMIPSLLSTGARVPMIIPGRGQVLVTSPIPSLKLNGSFHMDAGFYYFRSVDSRVLLGGGRNLDFATETTTSLETTPRVQKALEEILFSVIIPDHDGVTIDYRWAGSMAFTERKQPFVGFSGPHILVAFGCNGMGVALASHIGEQCAALLSEEVFC